MYQDLSAIGGAVLCWLTNLKQAGGPTIGACLPTVQLVREQFNETLTAVLALMLAARSRED